MARQVAMRWMRWGSALLVLWFCAALWIGARAASGFADPAFQAQWQQGEGLTPNFWGPLSTAKESQREPYKEAPGGMRLVQYFDKGRMELTNPASGTVTNGLLATELITGLVQIGDSSFQPRDPPAIPIAGDPDNPGPTYAQLATKAKALCDAAPDHTGSYTQAALSPSGDISVADAGPTPESTFAVFDGPTKHNVPKAFADYRSTAGLATIGYALCEPFTATVKVAAQQRAVLVQIFERRVLTYTATNPDPFKVEMGNIGQHYARWRYPAAAAAPSATATLVPQRSRNPTPTSDPSLVYAVTASVSPQRPEVTEIPVVTAQLTLNGHGVPGATMTTTWHLRSQDVYCDFGPSNADGMMSCGHQITRALPGVPCKIDVFVSYQDQIYTTTATFTPKASSA